jgi:hypothetical protein
LGRYTHNQICQELTGKLHIFNSSKLSENKREKQKLAVEMFNLEKLKDMAVRLKL